MVFMIPNKIEYRRMRHFHEELVCADSNQCVSNLLSFKGSQLLVSQAQASFCISCAMR
jgi:hypothetical protein